MVPRREPNGRNKALRVLYRWHRRLGVLAAILVLILAVTGVMLAHADRFGVLETNLAHPLIERLYGTEPRASPLASVTPAGWLVWIDGRLYLDGAPIGRGLDKLLGAVAAGDLIAVAGPAELLLITGEGRLVDRLGPASLPGELEAVGRVANGVVAVRAAGAVYLTSDFMGWSPASGDAEAAWEAATAAIPQTALEPALAAHRGAGVPLHRVILDLHTGRIFGIAGPWLMDAAAIVLLLLAGSGLVMWARRRPEGVRPRGRSD